MDSNMLFLTSCSLSPVRLICSEAVAIVKSVSVNFNFFFFLRKHQLKLELRAPKIKAAYSTLNII